MSCGEFSNYWTAKETYEALKIYIDMNYNGLRSDIGRCSEVDVSGQDAELSERHAEFQDKG